MTNATTNTTTDFDVTVFDDGHELWTGPISELVGSNPDLDLVELVGLDAPGDQVVVSGGAAASFEVKRVS